MIPINRRRKKNRRLVRPPKSWFDAARSQTERALREKSSHAFDSGIYAHPQARAALEELFHHKCAYCETQATAGFDWDVEHFRPKGRVLERADHPGYYWLAYE